MNVFFNLFIATRLETSSAWLKLKAFLGDLASFLALMAPIIGGAVIVYLFIRLSMADERDQKTWKDRIKLTIFSVIGAMLASGLLGVITSYFI